MANDLASYIDAVSQILDDTTNARYSDALITQAIRTALQEYNQYIQDQTYTIKDLDSASSTTVPTGHAHMFQVGSAGWTILFRSAGQAEANVLQPNVAAALKELADEYLEMFRATLNLPNMGGKADKLLSEFRSGIKADVKSAGAVLDPPPTDTW